MVVCKQYLKYRGRVGGCKQVPGAKVEGSGCMQKVSGTSVGAVVECKEFLGQGWRGGGCMQRVSGAKVGGRWLHA